nr:hypothetical protein [uncultured Cardiobacterium sp.]
MNTFYKSFNFTWTLSLFGTAVGARAYSFCRLMPVWADSGRLSS